MPAAHSWLGVPLIHTDRTIGMLSLTRLTASSFTEYEMGLAQNFARQAAIALQNAFLYDEVKSFNQELEHRVQERTEALQAAVDKLERLDRTKSEFVGTLANQLGTPLTVMQSTSGLSSFIFTVQATHA